MTGIPYVQKRSEYSIRVGLTPHFRVECRFLGFITDIQTKRSYTVHKSNVAITDLLARRANTNPRVSISALGSQYTVTLNSDEVACSSLPTHGFILCPEQRVHHHVYFPKLTTTIAIRQPNCCPSLETDSNHKIDLQQRPQSIVNHDNQPQCRSVQRNPVQSNPRQCYQSSGYASTQTVRSVPNGSGQAVT